MKKRFMNSSGLVLDLGMNNADDSAFYLKRGFDVVAVEANPSLVDQAKQRLAAEIAQGRILILNKAVWHDYDRQTFHINLENHHWSSLDPGWAGRNSSKTETITIDCLPLAALFALRGVPFFMKVDVEGVDDVVLAQLAALPVLPRLISVEDCRFGFDYMKTLHEAGYDGFKLLDQSTVAGRIDRHTGHVFAQGSSGPLGDDIDGPWLPYEEIIALYSVTVRDRDGKRLAPQTQWWDIHATCLNQSLYL